MKTRFQFFSEKCAACYACMIACMDQNDTDTANGGAPPRIVEQRDGTPRVYGVSRGCLHCEEPACVPACPAGCLYGDGETGMVLSDNTGCVSCGSCLAACPHNAVFFDTDGKMQKCDGCVERVRHGLEPACTRVCPTGALRLAAN